MENSNQEEKELDSGSLHNLDLSVISHDDEDKHDMIEEIHELDLEPPEDTMINESSQNRTDDESFPSIDHFPSSDQSQPDISDMSSLHLSDLNSSADTTKDESSVGGGKKRRKSRKRKKTKKSSKSKKVQKNRVTKKSKKTKTKRRRSAKLRLRKRLLGGLIGDNGIDMESYGGTNPYSVERDSDSRF
jgi:hypothetical protein